MDCPIIIQDNEAAEIIESLRFAPVAIPYSLENIGRLNSCGESVDRQSDEVLDSSVLDLNMTKATESRLERLRSALARSYQLFRHYNFDVASIVTDAISTTDLLVPCTFTKLRNLFDASLIDSTALCKATECLPTLNSRMWIKRKSYTSNKTYQYVLDNSHSVKTFLQSIGNGFWDSFKAFIIAFTAVFASTHDINSKLLLSRHGAQGMSKYTYKIPINNIKT